MYFDRHIFAVEPIWPGIRRRMAGGWCATGRPPRARLQQRPPPASALAAPPLAPRTPPADSAVEAAADRGCLARLRRELGRRARGMMMMVRGQTGWRIAAVLRSRIASRTGMAGCHKPHCTRASAPTRARVPPRPTSTVSAGVLESARSGQTRVSEGREVERCEVTASGQ